MEQHQKDIDQYFRKEGWSYWTPHEILARLMEETGGLARLINHLYGPKKKKVTESAQEIEEEIGDVLYTLACLANVEGISLDEALKKSIDKVILRDKGRFNSLK